MYPCLMISNGPDVVHPRRGHCLWRIRRLGSVRRFGRMRLIHEHPNGRSLRRSLSVSD